MIDTCMSLDTGICSMLERYLGNKTQLYIKPSIWNDSPLLNCERKPDYQKTLTSLGLDPIRAYGLVRMKTVQFYGPRDFNTLRLDLHSALKLHIYQIYMNISKLIDCFGSFHNLLTL